MLITYLIVIQIGKTEMLVDKYTKHTLVFFWYFENIIDIISGQYPF